MVVVLVRVETGVSYDNNTLRTMNSMNSIRRTPFASLKFNQTTKVGQSDSSNASGAFTGSSYAQIDTGTLPDVVMQNLNYSSVTTTGTHLI